MTHTTTKATAARRATRYRQLDRAMYAVFSDVLDYCDSICEQAEQRLGTTDEDVVVNDPAYAAALKVFGEVFDIKTRIEHFRSTWIGDD
ncbi:MULTISPECIES: hypothetical protein [unclassified Kribbella]|uniref:hypothetical protein n=1 Tax=unclassified Kribbella TaxID=2644121 RepID=UPI003078A4EC